MILSKTHIITKLTEARINSKWDKTTKAENNNLIAAVIISSTKLVRSTQLRNNYLPTTAIYV